LIIALLDYYIYIKLLPKIWILDDEYITKEERDKANKIKIDKNTAMLFDNIKKNYRKKFETNNSMINALKSVVNDKL
jgi:hypothetical protein